MKLIFEISMDYVVLSLKRRGIVWNISLLTANTLLPFLLLIGYSCPFLSFSSYTSVEKIRQGVI